MKIVQSTDNKRPGRPTLASNEELLRYEALWVDTLQGLRDGAPATKVESRGTSGMFVKVSGQEKLPIMSKQDREKMHIIFPGQIPRIVRQPKFTSTPDELVSWKVRTEEEEEKFNSITRGDVPIMRIVQAVPSERQLWEDLKRARTAAQVRRICGRSKLWLKPRWEFPNGGHIEWWPYRRALYKYAEKFCRAKVDRRYPSRDSRDSGDYRRIEYLARVMAGLSLGIAATTAVERLRKMKHTRQCQCWRCNLKIGPRHRLSLARFLAENKRLIDDT